jgi:hypothetical protein
MLSSAEWCGSRVGLLGGVQGLEIEMSENNHVVLETKELDEAKAMRTALHSEFSDRRLWVCVLKNQNEHTVTVGDHWGARLTDEEAKPVLAFAAKLKEN